MRTNKIDKLFKLFHQAHKYDRGEKVFSGIQHSQNVSQGLKTAASLLNRAFGKGYGDDMYETLVSVCNKVRLEVEKDKQFHDHKLFMWINEGYDPVVRHLNLVSRMDGKGCDSYHDEACGRQRRNPQGFGLS